MPCAGRMGTAPPAQQTRVEVRPMTTARFMLGTPKPVVFSEDRSLHASLKLPRDLAQARKSRGGRSLPRPDLPLAQWAPRRPVGEGTIRMKPRIPANGGARGRRPPDPRVSGPSALACLGAGVPDVNGSPSQTGHEDALPGCAGAPDSPRRAGGSQVAPQRSPGCSEGTGSSRRERTMSSVRGVGDATEPWRRRPSASTISSVRLLFRRTTRCQRICTVPRSIVRKVR